MARARPRTLVAAALVVMTLLAPPAATAHNAHVWSNSNGFSSGCLGFIDTYPKQLYDLTRAQLGRLAFSPISGAIGAGFTRNAVLAGVGADFAFYAHSHGDNYWAASGKPNVDSAFLQDPGAGDCNDYRVDMVRSSAIKARTAGVYNFVIMSTCELGSSTSTMPEAFGIAKTKTSTENEFFLGYAYLTYDSAQLRFENAFWTYLTAAPYTRTAYQAFTYAKSIGGYPAPDSSNPFTPNWWGNPDYDGKPGAGGGCSRCV